MKSPKGLIAICGLICMAIQMGGASAADFPDKPIQLYVAFAPGGGADINARIVARKASEILGRAIVIVNRGGAGGILAPQIVASAKPDGHTLLQVTITHAIAEGIYKDLTYHLLTSFAPVAATGSTDYILAVNKDVPANNAAQFISYARSATHPVTSGTSGNNGPTDLATKLFAHSAGIPIQGIPYKGASETISDLVSGRVQMSFIVVPAALALVHAQKIKALGVTGLHRSALAPQLPTIDESGLKGYSASTWFGIVAPAGTPDAILEKLHDAFTKATQDPETHQRLAQIGYETTVESRKQFGEFMRNEVNRWAQIIAATGVQKQSLH